MAAWGLGGYIKGRGRVTGRGGGRLDVGERGGYGIGYREFL